MRTGNVRQLEQFYEPLGRWFQVSVFPSQDGISIFSLDVTDQHMQRERLMLTEKLAATGRLAATIAHEINNPLESVLNLIYLARTSIANADTLKKYLLTAEKEITRVSHIARHTLGFYRDTSMPAQIDPEALLKEVLIVYESRLRAAAIEVQVHCSAKSTVKGLRGEMHQVFSNLISNSIDAMPGSGTISIAIEDSIHDGTKGIDITFSDTGKGIPSENLLRLFEPFFTTKPNAGTGLGLWVVKQFIDSWRGRIEVESSTDKNSHGTTFHLFVPLVALSKTLNLKIETTQT
jgi:signal transduction histidine kinase